MIPSFVLGDRDRSSFEYLSASSLTLIKLNMFENVYWLKVLPFFVPLQPNSETFTVINETRHRIVKANVDKQLVKVKVSN